MDNWVITMCLWQSLSGHTNKRGPPALWKQFWLQPQYAMRLHSFYCTVMYETRSSWEGLFSIIIISKKEVPHDVSLLMLCSYWCHWHWHWWCYYCSMLPLLLPLLPLTTAVGTDVAFLLHRHFMLVVVIPLLLHPCVLCSMVVYFSTYLSVAAVAAAVVVVVVLAAAVACCGQQGCCSNCRSWWYCKVHHC